MENLVPLIGKKIFKFQTILKENGLIKNGKRFNCIKRDPFECFQIAIVDPLSEKLDTVGRTRSFILIDALDECLDKEGSHQSKIVNILYREASDLPNWVKLIITSRNNKMTTNKMSKINLTKLAINVKDQRNKQDLRTYAERTLLQNVTTETSSGAKISHIQELIDYALKFSGGNFLFIKTIVKYWQKYPDKMNPESIPESLQDIYATSFTERFKEISLDKFEPFLEILLASTLPPKLSQLKNILEYHDKSYNTRKVANALSEYFKTAIDQGPLEFHHQFFAEWLVNQTEGKAGIVINKPRGHQYIFDYLLNDCEKKQTNLTMKELSELFAHFLHGKETTQSNLRRLGSLKVSEIRDYMNRCILHNLASKRDSPELLVEFVKQFNSVDILDDDGWTPAMYAVKAGNYENVKFFIDNKANLDYVVEQKVCYLKNLRADTMISIAADEGHVDITDLLIQRGANVEKTNKCGWKPLHRAAWMGHFEIANFFINKGAQPDVLSLHHSAAENHTEIVQLILDAGVRDECLPCKSGNWSWCAMNVNNFHLCICETALYAAVSGNNLEMAKLILQYSNTSVNCRHASGLTALMEAFYSQNIQMVELLINAGADINAECESPSANFVYDCTYYRNPLYGSYCYQRGCDGRRVIDFFFAYGFWKAMTPFMSKFNTSLDNARLNPATVAVIYDRVDFINATYGYRTKSIPNIETVLRYVAVCHSIKTLEHLLYSEDVSKFTTVYEDGKTLLHLAILGSVESEVKVHVTQSCPSSLCICPKLSHSGMYLDENHSETVKLLTKVLKSDINKQDQYGRTALHYAVVQFLYKVSGILTYLINEKLEWTAKDKRGDTALEFALRERPHVVFEFHPCQWTDDHVLEVCQSTSFDRLARLLLRTETITECDMRAKKLLAGLVHHRLPLSLYSLFKSGLDVNCAREHFIRYLNQTVFNDSVRVRERDDLLEVFKIFQIDVQVVCGVSFRQSELHLMAYYLRNPSFQVGNLSKLTESKRVEILNECYDKEGYLPIHRAVQGRNTFAFSWFIEIGVDITRKTKSGFTVLLLAIRRLLDLHYWISGFREDYILKQILKITKEKNLTHAFFQCNSDISPFHVAATKFYVAVNLQLFTILNPKQLLTCTNSDGIQPIYLLYLYYQNTTRLKELLLEL